MFLQRLLSCCAAAFLPLAAFANPVISEFMADNVSTIADNDGDFRDWVEIHNPTTSPINLDQWRLTDNAAQLAKWTFPAVTIQPGEFLIVWASSKNRTNPAAPLHTNFSLAAGGEYLALVQPNGTTVQQDFGVLYPSQAGNESYGKQFTTTNLVTQGDSAKYRIPADGTLGINWRTTTFNDTSWSSGATGIGYGLLVPGITVRQVVQNGSYGTLSSVAGTDALLALSAPHAQIAAEATEVASTVNYLGEGGDGHYGSNRTLPTGQLNNYAIKATGFINIPTAGTYTFGLNSDDGGRIKIDGITVMLDDTNHGPADHLGSTTLTAGTHSFEVIMWEGGGGDEVEFYAAAGTYAVWDPVMRLVGDTGNGGLTALTVPAGAGGIVQTNVESVMKNVNATCYVRRTFTSAGPSGFTALSLKMRYNDGYAAFLNGTPIGTRNAPVSLTFNSAATASRTDAASLIPEAVNVTSFLPQLINGSNVLAIHGLNDAASGSTFLALPELIAGSINMGAQSVYFGGGKATPGYLNGAYSLLGKVADTQFNLKRGIFTAPISVTITSLTPAAQIRYTTDGSPPTATTGTLYTAPLAISTTTVIRAAAFLTDYEPTDVDTQTYLFLNDVILQSSGGAPAPGWPATSGTAQVLDYGMDPDIVNHADPNQGGAATVKNALLAIPSVCITTALSNLFNINGSQGIYSNPGGRGFAWERPASIEWIAPPDALNPNGSTEFQINAGIRMRGGYSRSTDNPKHGWHLFFRGDYGATKLEYPVFGKGGSYDFDQLDLRTAQNYSWSFGGDGNNTFLREESTRLAQRDMGHQHGRLRYFHLYINGQYWGLHNTEERTEASFAESYYGGAKADYDVVKGEQDAGYTTGVTDGNLTAWQELWNKSKAHLASPTNANYFMMMGLAADGVTATADPVLLDDIDLIDYMLLTFWTGNLDGAVSAFLGNNNANNWFGIRNRLGTKGGFKYMAHDFEHTFFNVNEDRTGPFINANYASFTYSNPMFLHQDLMANAEFKIRWADRVHKHMFNGGALTSTVWNNRINGIAAIVDDVIVAESARWGDAKVPATPFTRQSWITAQNNLLNYLPARGPVVLNQLRTDGLYPTLNAPTMNPFGGYRATGTEVVLQASNGGVIYYMPDGTDPRAIGGALRPGALIYTPSTTNETLIATSSAGWKYLADGSNQGTAWQLAGYNDAAWPTGSSELGYGDTDQNPAGGLIPIVDVDPVTAGVQKAATYYFRRTFTVTNPTGIVSASIDAEYDDSVAIYINGTYIGGTLTANPAFNFYSGSAIEDTISTYSVPPGVFINGTNIVAVEIHQANNVSSDVSMNLSLTTTRSSTSTPYTLSGGPVKPVRARAYVSGTATWSALTDATFLIDTDPASTANLAISEIMYHPADPTPTEIGLGHLDADDFEYIEFVNIGPRTIDLEGVYLYGAIDFDFTGALTGRTLAPGARVIIAAKKSAFEARYGTGHPVAGSYGGNLDNGGEQIVLYTPGGATIRNLSYDDIAPWPTAADGAGYSLIRIAPTTNIADDQPASAWRTSLYPGGSPGGNDLHNFAGWKALNNVTDHLADGDKDGLNNALEYVLGGALDVMDQSRTCRVGTATFTVLGVPGTYTTISVTRRTLLRDVTFTLESAPDLVLGPWDTASTVFVSATPNPDGSETLLYRSTALHGTGGKRYFRASATIAP